MAISVAHFMYTQGDTKLIPKSTVDQGVDEKENGM